MSETILVFDSGLGGLTVLSAIRSARPGARAVYLADDACFPYGALEEAALVARVVALMDEAIARERPDVVVIACNTVSTLVLPPLRARFSVPFVGTVPAVKPAAAVTRSGLFSVLATPGTVARDYTRGLIAEYAAGARVTLVGSRRLAGLAEAHLRGEPVEAADIVAEIAPCFVEAEGARSDVVVLACTHYPWLLGLFEKVAPWPVTWIDPAPAIARRVDSLLGPAPAGPGGGRAHFTSGAAPAPALAPLLAGLGLAGPASVGEASGSA